MTGTSDSSLGVGVRGTATSASGTTYGVYGQNASSLGAGVLGLATSTSGDTFGVKGTSDSSSGAGVRGPATSASGDHVWRVWDECKFIGRSAFYGLATSTSGDTFGVKGKSESSIGIGVRGTATSASGTTLACRDRMQVHRAPAF